MERHTPLAIVLAAGRGTRMESDLPKVLCRANGRPLIDYVLDALRAAGVSKIVAVVGYRADLVRDHLTDAGVTFALQEPQWGTGHAVQCCGEHLAAHRGPVLVVAGDSPLLQSRSLSQLLERFAAAQPACLLGTLHKDDPTGLGRIVRDDAGRFLKIVEQKDATPDEQQLTEVNMSTYVFDSGELQHALERLRNHNQQREYYLTDCPGILQAEGKLVEAAPVLAPCEALSVNTPAELALVERELQRAGDGGK